MNEDALRALIRETIARVHGEASAPSSAHDTALIDLAKHASHYRYTLPKAGSACVIEPGVTCNHCGYCESHGH